MTPNPKGIPLMLAIGVATELIRLRFEEFDAERFLIGLFAVALAGILMAGPIFGLIVWSSANQPDRSLE